MAVRRVQLAEDIPALFENEWRPPDDATIAEALTAYVDEMAVIDRHLATADMDDRNQTSRIPVNTRSGGRSST